MSEQKQEDEQSTNDGDKSIKIKIRIRKGHKRRTNKRRKGNPDKNFKQKYELVPEKKSKAQIDDVSNAENLQVNKGTVNNIARSTGTGQLHRTVYFPETLKDLELWLNTKTKETKDENGFERTDVQNNNILQCVVTVQSTDGSQNPSDFYYILILYLLLFVVYCHEVDYQISLESVTTVFCNDFKIIMMFSFSIRFNLLLYVNP